MRKPPRAEPIRPPALQAAWKEDMMTRPHRVSTTLAWAFIGPSTTMFTKPNRNAHAARKPIPGDRRWVWGRASSRSAIKGPEIRSVRPVPPIFDGSTPATGMADRPPTAAANSTIERRASVRPKSVLISGIATAHAPMQRPLAKKIAVTPPRARTRPFARAESIVEERLTRRNLKHDASDQPIKAFDACKPYRSAREPASVLVEFRSFPARAVASVIPARQLHRRALYDARSGLLSTHIRDAVSDDMRNDADTTGRQRSTELRNRSVDKTSEMVTSAV